MLRAVGDKGLESAREARWKPFILVFQKRKTDPGLHSSGASLDAHHIAQGCRGAGWDEEKGVRLEDEVGRGSVDFCGVLAAEVMR